MWGLAHVGLKGNEEGDRLAKQALQRDTMDLQVPFSKSEVKGVVWSKAGFLHNFYFIQLKTKGD